MYKSGPCISLLVSGLYYGPIIHPIILSFTFVHLVNNCFDILLWRKFGLFNQLDDY